jgi:predicted transcriptional regulator
MMVDFFRPDFATLLNSFSNEISLKILKTYERAKDGLNLTDTSKIIEEKNTTVKDHLIKLLDSNLIYVQEKKYYLSYFGALILEQVRNIELLDRTRKIFGHVSSKMIPTRFVTKFIPYLKGVEVSTNQWAFMNLGNKLIEIIKNNQGVKKIVLKLIGWNSIQLSLEIMRNSFPNIFTEKDAMKKLFNDINLSLITDKSFLEEVGDKNIIKAMALPEFKERVLIYPNLEQFSFMLIRYDKYITFFLNTNQEANLGPYFIIKSKKNDDPSPIETFEEIFEYFSKRSTPLVDILNE